VSESTLYKRTETDEMFQDISGVSRSDAFQRQTPLLLSQPLKSHANAFIASENCHQLRAVILDGECKYVVSFNVCQYWSPNILLVSS
jgi:hypothetical protein